MPPVSASKLDYSTTFAAEACVLASQLLVYRVVADRFGTEGFAVYALTRRALTLLLPFGVVGLDVALPRFIAYAAAAQRKAADQFIPAALLVTAVSVGLTSAIVLTLQQPLGELLFGESGHAALVATLPLLLAGAALHVLAYGALRGRGDIQRANLVMAVNHGGWPLALLALGLPLPGFLAAIGMAWSASSAIALLLSPRSFGHILDHSRELISFGARRVPGDLVQLLFFGLPAILVAHAGGLEQAGVVALALTALGLVGSGLTPISFVLLPFAARLLQRGAVDVLRAHVTLLAKATLPLIVAGIAFVEIFAPQILSIYLGPQYVAGSTALRLSMLAALPWGTYVVLKSVLDARHEAARNARNLTMAFIVYTGLTAIVLAASLGVMFIIGAFVAGMYVLGILTVTDTRKALAASQNETATSDPS